MKYLVAALACLVLAGVSSACDYGVGATFGYSGAAAQFVAPSYSSGCGASAQFGLGYAAPVRQFGFSVQRVRQFNFGSGVYGGAAFAPRRQVIIQRNFNVVPRRQLFFSY